MRRRGEEWAALRANHLRTYPECRVCDSDRNTVVHHLRYRGPAGSSERSGDLVTLCASCHDELHRQLGRTPKMAWQLDYIGACRLERLMELVAQ
jgi:5-methylcytosine-specific restriction endonuclease McrA